MGKHFASLRLNRPAIAIAVGVMFILSGCKKTPEGVLDHEEMASLMADIHIGESVVDFNYAAFPNDSTRKLLKQSIYASHNVTSEEVDTSYVWYGNHIEDYIKVYERTIEIIQERQKSVAQANYAQISIAGDSVEVWHAPRPLLVQSNMPSRILTFNLYPDSTWHKDDVYMLAYKPINATGKIDARLIIDYSDGTSAYVDVPTTLNSSSLKIQMDSTLTPLRVYGYMTFSNDNSSAYEVDSISLTRMRRNLMTNSYIPTNIFSAGKTKSEEINTEDLPPLSVPQDGNFKSNRRTPSVPRKQHAAGSGSLPRSSSETSAKSEHRQDATMHKPTPEQRREANRRRNGTAVPLKRMPAKEQPASK